MTRYAEVNDVQARLPRQLILIEASSQPSIATVLDWLDAASLFINAALAWKYRTPITANADCALLKPITAALVASQVWTVLGGHDGTTPSNSIELRKEALQMLAYDAKTGRAHLVLPGSGPADSGEAALDQAVATFSDPDACGSVPRAFRMDMEL